MRAAPRLSMMTQEIAWWISYPLFLVALGTIAFATWLGLRRWLDRTLGTLHPAGTRE